MVSPFVGLGCVLIDRYFAYVITQLMSRSPKACRPTPSSRVETLRHSSDHARRPSFSQQPSLVRSPRASRHTISLVVLASHTSVTPSSAVRSAPGSIRERPIAPRVSRGSLSHELLRSTTSSSPASERDPAIARAAGSPSEWPATGQGSMPDSSSVDSHAQIGEVEQRLR